MRFLIAPLLLLLLTFSFSYAQEECGCCSPKYKQFDFWIGDWNVYDKSGQQVGENLIQKLEDDCILNERWKGAKGGTGRSYNYYDATDDTWNQLWLDNKGSNLKLKGKREGNKMILTSEWLKGTKVALYANRITWIKHKDGSITQLWEIIGKDGNVLSIAFEGIYKRK